MQRVIHFEIYTRDPEAVCPFYQDVFGWKFKKFEGGPIEYWLVTTGDDKDPGINGGLARPREGQSPGTINTIAVPSLDQSIKKIEERGGKICVPKMEIPNVGWLAYAEDPVRQRLRSDSARYEGTVIGRKRIMSSVNRTCTIE